MRRLTQRVLLTCSTTWAAALITVLSPSLADAQTGVADVAAKSTPSTRPVEVGVAPQLFIDDYLIAESHGIAKVTQHPKRTLDGPVVGSKEHTTQPYVTVLRDPESGRFRMWYNYDIGVEAAIAYAESDDGIKWTFPALNLLGPDNRLFNIGRSEEHGSYGVSVVDDGPAATDRPRRYKLMWWSAMSEPAGAAMASSPDGIHWTPYEGNPVLPLYDADHPKAAIGVGDIVDLFRDPFRERYGALIKLHALKADGWEAGPRAKKVIRRLVGASYSEDAVHWKEPWRVIVPEPRDEGLLEFYSAGGTIARGPLLISFVRMLHDDYSPEPGGEPTGIGYTTLATSRDGVHWERHDDIFFDRNPKPGTWDRAMSWIGSAVAVGDELYLYYGGYKRGHKVEPTTERQLGLVKMPMDRFVARQASGQTPGRLLTVPLALRAGAGSRLVLNANATGGRIRVQVRDLHGRVTPGFALDNCMPVVGDGLALPVQWRDQQDGTKGKVRQLTSFDAQVVQLEFEVQQAALYGFSIETLNNPQHAR